MKIFKVKKIRRTRYSNVRGISRIDLTPAQTTATGVLPSSIKSALISKAETESHQGTILRIVFHLN